MKILTKELEQTRQSSLIEQNEHRDIVEGTKASIKRIKSELDDIQSGTHSIQTSFATDISNRRSARLQSQQTKRQEMKDEIGMFGACFKLLCIVTYYSSNVILQTNEHLSQKK